MTERQTPPTLPAKDAAALLGISVRTLDRYQAAGTISPCPVPQRPRKFRVADLEALATPKPVNAK